MSSTKTTARRDEKHLKVLGFVALYIRGLTVYIYSTHVVSYFVSGRATQATKLSSVTLTERGKVTVEARLADDHVFDKLEIFVDQKKVYFPNEETRIQFHTGKLETRWLGARLQ